MATLQESAQSILNEKNSKVLPENIVAGVTMFGIEGKASNLDTSNATANAGDILMGQTAYVNGQLIEGEMMDLGVAHSLANNFNNDDEMLLVIEGTANDSGYVTSGQTTLSIDTNKIELAETVGLTSDKIKKGEIILGIEGTYESGSSILEYNSYDEMNVDTAQTESTKAIVGDSVYQATASEKEGETMWVTPSVYTDATLAYDTLVTIGLEGFSKEYEGMGATEEKIQSTLDKII